MAERTVSVRLQARVDQYVGGMKKADAATRQMQKAAERTRKESVLLQRATQVAGVAVAATFAKKIITAASDLNETISKSSVVFRSNASAVQSWAKSSATAFGMSENAALSAASTYGNLFVSLGLSSEQASGMSTKLVELAGDLASFNNVDPSVALDALRSGLVGETEPLRAFGVNMNDATLRAEALALGLDATTQTLDPAVKAQAAYSLILKQTKTAQGDFARTADGLANQQRILNAEWENAQAALGQNLLPVANEAVKVLNGMLSTFNALPAPIQTATVAALALGAAVVFLAPKVMAAKVALAELGITSRLSGLALNGFGKFAGIATVALVGMTVAVGKINESAADAVPKVDLLTKGLGDLATKGTGVLTSASDETISFADAVNRLADPSLTDRLGDFWGFLGSGGDAGPELVAMRKYIENIDSALAGMVADGNAAQAAKAFELLAKDAEAHGYSLEQVKQMLPQYTSSLNSATTATVEAGNATATTTDKTKSFSDVLRDFNSVAVDSAQSQLNLSGAARTLAESMMENGNSFNTATAAGQANMSALLDVTQAITDHAAAVYTQTGSVAQATAAMEIERAALINNLQATGMSAGAAAGLVDQFLRIPQAAASAAGGLQGFAAAAATAWGAAARLLTSAAGFTKSNVNVGFNIATPKIPKVSVPKVSTPKVPKVATSKMSDFRAPTISLGDGFDLNGYTQAVQRVREANRSYADSLVTLAEARTKANEAGSPEEQAQAMKALAEAERDTAAAKREVAAADKAKADAKVTGKNIGKSFSGRAQRLDAFRRNLAILAKRGLSKSIIMQLLDAGIDEGGDMAAALVRDGNIAQLNATQAAIEKDQRALGIAYGGTTGGSGVSGSGGSSTGTTGSTSAAVVLSFENASKPVVLKVEGEQVWKALLKVKRARGGASLGLS